jgi:hypothetical protein
LAFLYSGVTLVGIVFSAGETNARAIHGRSDAADGNRPRASYHIPKSLIRRHTNGWVTPVDPKRAAGVV